MKKYYSQVHQLGYIVRNMKESMEYYGKIYSIKQWYRAVNKPVGQLYYHGKSFIDNGYEVVIGYCGRTEIELITTGGDVENIYTEFIKRHGYGLHHFCFFVKDIDPYIKEYQYRGWKLAQHGCINGKRTKSRFAYMVPPDDTNNTIVEFGETHLGPFKMTRNKLNMLIGVLTGDAEKL